MSAIIKSLDRFIGHLEGSREVGAIITQDEAVKAKLKQYLQSQYFSLVTRPVTLVAALSHHHKIMIDPIDMNESEYKQLYDIVCQYPSGSLQITDPRTFRVYNTNRILRDHKTVIILTKKELVKLQKAFPFLDSLGMVWRDEAAQAVHGVES